MAEININDFMSQFHGMERDLALFDDTANGELWWDSVRFEVCYFLYDCLAGLTYSSVYRPIQHSRSLGRLRRGLERQVLLLASRFRRRDLLLIRAARSVVDGVRHDVVLDPAAVLFRSSSTIIDTIPRRFHLRDCPADAVGMVPENIDLLLSDILSAFSVDPVHLSPLVRRIRRIRAEYRYAVDSYRQLLDNSRPRAILMVQNGLEKALYHVAADHGIPVLEMQHGLIGFGHPAYSYARDIDLGRQTGFPTHFLTFSSFWSRSGYYPAKEHVVVGTDHFASGIELVRSGLGEIMVIAADIYQADLVLLTRRLAARLPDRRIIFKLHPNQGQDEPSIRAEFADFPNVTLGSAATPAVQIMKDVTHLVAIQSTVVYEALQSGRRVVIIPRYDYHLHADIFEEESVSIPFDDDSLMEALEIPAARAPVPIFFERFDPDRVRSLLMPFLEPS